jgi:hypothetical protein
LGSRTDPQGVKAGVTSAEEWLDAIVRLALQSSVSDAEPPPAIWIRIRRRIPRDHSGGLDGGDVSWSEIRTVRLGRYEMFSWSDIMVQQECYADLLREAEKERLIQRMLAGRGRRDRFYRQALIWLGRLLITWGCHLQERYGAAAVHPAGCTPYLVNR